MTKVAFELIEQHILQGYINQTFSTTVTVVPETNMEGHTQSNMMESSLFTPIIQSWDNDDTASETLEAQATFNMPLNGEVYFFGRHTEIIGPIDESRLNISFNDASGNASFAMKGDNQIQ